jgi:hypothetical protein
MDADDQARKVDYLFKVLARYDVYITSTNVKAALILAFNSAVMGWIVAGDNHIVGFFSNPKMQEFVSFLVSAILVASALSMACAFHVVMPSLGSKQKNGGNSMMFFADVATMSSEKYGDKLEQASLPSLLRDLAEQVHEVACVLTKKMSRVNRSIVVVAVEVFLIGFVAFLHLLSGG